MIVIDFTARTWAKQVRLAWSEHAVAVVRGDEHIELYRADEDLPADITECYISLTAQGLIEQLEDSCDAK